MVPRVDLPPPLLLLLLLNAKREDAFTDDFQRCWRLLTLSAIKMNAASSSAFDDAFESANAMITSQL